MDPRPPKLLLLLTSLLSLWQRARGQSSYTIDTAVLTILPGSTVQSGTPVTLRCKVSVSHDDIPDLVHTFLLTRDGVDIHSNTTTADSVEYELNPARAADSGSYECRVMVKDKSRASFSQKLDVTGLQTPILYINKMRPFESEEFTASCSAPEEKGSLIFRFYQRLQSGESQKIKQLAPTGNSSETTLALRVVGDRFLYCDYEINLVSGTRRSNQSNEIQVIVRALYISPTMNVLPSSNVYEGDVIEVVCKVISELKNIEVFLVKDRRILKQARMSLNHRFRAVEGESGELVCKAEWNNVQKETYQSITVNEIFSKPTLTLEQTELFEGDRFKLTCSISIYHPEKLDNRSLVFSIYKDNAKLTSEDTYISVAHPQKNGNYSCQVHRSPDWAKRSQTIVVKARIPVSKPTLRVVGDTLVLGRPFQLLCHSDNGTLPVVYTLNGPNRQIQRMVVRKPEERAIFNCSAINEKSELNNIICHVKNGQQRPAVFGLGQRLPRTTNIIVPVSEPVLTMLPSAGDISEGQDLTIFCSIQKGTPPFTYSWYHTKKGPLTSENSTKLEETFRIKSIEGKHRGGYYCESTNPANMTKRSHIVMIGVKMAGWKKGLITVFCLLLLFALFLVFIFRKRLLQFKRRRTAELSVKSVGTKVERLSLTQAEVNEAANVTPGIMGKSIWSEHVSGSESDDQNSVTSPEKQEPRYTEVPTRQEETSKVETVLAPEEKILNPMSSDVRNSTQGVPEQADGQGSVEYAQLNHEADHHCDQSNHVEHNAQEEPTVEIDNGVTDNSDDNHTAEQEALINDQTPDS